MGGIKRQKITARPDVRIPGKGRKRRGFENTKRSWGPGARVETRFEGGLLHVFQGPPQRIKKRKKKSKVRNLDVNCR